MDTTTKIALAGIFFGFCVWFFRAYVAPLFAENEMKRGYQSAANPQLVLQSCEMDTDFWAKVQRERARYEQSGNKWALEQNPVIPFPFNREFSFQWFEKRFDVSTVGLGQREYLAAAMRQYDECLKIWQQKTGKEFGFDATFQANGQKAFDGDLWANKSNAN